MVPVILAIGFGAGVARFDLHERAVRFEGEFPRTARSRVGRGGRRNSAVAASSSGRTPKHRTRPPGDGRPPVRCPFGSVSVFCLPRCAAAADRLHGTEVSDRWRRS